MNYFFIFYDIAWKKIILKHQLLDEEASSAILTSSFNDDRTHINQNNDECCKKYMYRILKSNAHIASTINTR